MRVIPLNRENLYWNKTIVLAEKCSWRAGINLVSKMRENNFFDFECPFALIVDDNVIGFCTITKTDYIPNCVYTPWIGYVFIDEKYRGNNYSEFMIKYVLSYAKQKGFKNVYISTEEEGLYERYGFKLIGMMKSYDNSLERILICEL